ncbi:MAG: hypothetical protein ACJ72N_07940 [Labedaea sp.]
MTDTDRNPPGNDPPPRQPRPLRLARIGWLLVLGFLLLGVAILSVRNVLDRSPQLTVLVPDKDIPAYQRIEPGDLKPMRINAEPGRGFHQDRRLIEGHYSLTMLSVDKPIPIESIGPAAPGDLNRSYVFSLEGGANVSLGGQLSRGSRVDVLMPGQPAPARLEGLFVLDVRAITNEKWAVTLASSKVMIDSQAALVAEGRANLVRRPVE